MYRRIRFMSWHRVLQSKLPNLLFRFQRFARFLLFPLRHQLFIGGIDDVQNRLWDGVFRFLGERIRVATALSFLVRRRRCRRAIRRRRYTPDHRPRFVSLFHQPRNRPIRRVHLIRHRRQLSIRLTQPFPRFKQLQHQSVVFVVKRLQ